MVVRSLPDNVSDEDQATLVRGMLAGSRSAWREFHARYSRLVFRCIGRVIGRFQFCATDDEVNEVYATFLAQLWANDMSKLRTFDLDRGHRLSAWVGTMATHCAIDHLRVLRREPERVTLEAIEDDVLCEEPSPHEALDRKEQLAVAAQMLRDLPAKDRELFTLYFGEGLDPDEIAARMAISVNTVYSKKHKLQSRFEARFAAAALAA
jgi:RNA polymerase sigma-70 factor (ECF subfamily)